MEEIWRDIPGYEGRYQVSNLGHSNRIDMVIVGNEGRQIIQVEQVSSIRDRLAKGDSCKAIANDYGVHPSTISKIKCGRSFSWLE